MGGYGSTRWGWHTKKDTVEDSLKLDASVLPSISERGGTLAWSRGGRMFANIGLYANFDDQCVTLRYNVGGIRTDEVIRLTATYPFNTVPRWWFSCPTCNRRCRCLYLAPGARRFLCRQCHDLSYIARQEKNVSRHLERLIPGLALLEKADKLEKRMDKYKYWCAGKQRIFEQYMQIVDQMVQDQAT